MGKKKRPQQIKVNSNSSWDDFLASEKIDVDSLFGKKQTNTDVAVMEEPEQQRSPSQYSSIFGDTEIPYAEGKKQSSFKDLQQPFLGKQPLNIQDTTTATESVSAPKTSLENVATYQPTELEKDFTELNNFGQELQKKQENLDTKNELAVNEFNKLVDAYNEGLEYIKKKYPAMNLPSDVVGYNLDNGMNLPIKEASIDESTGENGILADFNPLSLYKLAQPEGRKQAMLDVRDMITGDRTRQGAKAYTELVTGTNPKDETPINRLVGSYAQGLTSVGEGLVGMTKYATDKVGSFTGGIIGTDPKKKNALQQNLNAWIKEITPENPNFIEQLSSGAGSMTVFLPFGMGVTTLAKALGTVSPKLAYSLGTTGMTVIEAMTEAGSVYNETGNSAAAEKTFLANMLLIGVTNKLGIRNENIKNEIFGKLAGMSLEGIQEAGQEIISSVSKGELVNWDDVLTSGAIGAIIGLGVSNNAKKDAPTDTPEQQQTKTIKDLQNKQPIDPVDAKNKMQQDMQIQSEILQKSGIPEERMTDYALSSVADGKLLRNYLEEVQAGELTIDEAAERVKRDYEKMLSGEKEGEFIEPEVTPETEQPEEKVSSTQVNIPKEQTKQFVDFANTIPDNELYVEKNGDYSDYGRETEPHVTALYGLKTTNPADVEKVIKDYGDVTIELGKTSLFTNDKYDVLKVDIKSKDLKNINKLLRDNLEYKSDFPDYTPHLTVAYLKPGEGKKYVGDKRFVGQKIKLSELFFSDPEYKKTPIKLTKQPPSELDSAINDLVGSVKGEKKGRDLFTADELKRFDDKNIDVSKVTAKYKAEALQQLAFQEKGSMSNNEVREEYYRTDLLREISNVEDLAPVAEAVLRKRFGLPGGEDHQMPKWQIEQVDNAEKSIRKKLDKKYPKLKQTPKPEGKKVKAGKNDKIINEVFGEDNFEGVKKFENDYVDIYPYASFRDKDGLIVKTIAASVNDDGAFYHIDAEGKIYLDANATYPATYEQVKKAWGKAEADKWQKLIDDHKKPEKPKKQPKKKAEPEKVFDPKPVYAEIINALEIANDKTATRQQRTKFKSMLAGYKNQLLKNGIAAQIEKSGTKWIFKIDGVRQTKITLGIQEKSEKVKPEDVEIENENAKIPFEKLPDDIVRKQTIVADLVRAEDLPKGIGEAALKKGVQDIKEDAGKEQNPEAQIVRDVAEDILKNGHDNIVQIKGQQRQNLSAEEINEFVDDQIKKEDTPEAEPKYLSEARRKLQDLESDVFASDAEIDQARKQLKAAENKFADEQNKLIDVAPTKKPDEKKPAKVKKTELDKLIKTGSLKELQDYLKHLDLVAEAYKDNVDEGGKVSAARMMVKERINYLRNNKGKGQDIFQAAEDEKQADIFDQKPEGKKIPAWIKREVQEYKKELEDKEKTYTPEVGDIVEYNGEVWEVGFINSTHFKGTVRLQTTGNALIAKQQNYVKPEELKFINKAPKNVEGVVYPSAILKNIAKMFEQAEDQFDVDRVIDRATTLPLSGDRNKATRQKLIKDITGEDVPKTKAGITEVKRVITEWFKNNQPELLTYKEAKAETPEVKKAKGKPIYEMSKADFEDATSLFSDLPKEAQKKYLEYIVANDNNEFSKVDARNALKSGKYKGKGFDYVTLLKNGDPLPFYKNENIKTDDFHFNNILNAINEGKIKSHPEYPELTKPQSKFQQKANKAKDDLDDAIDDLLGEFKKPKLLSSIIPGVDPEMLAKGMRVVELYTKQNVYKFADIISNLYTRIGEETRTIFDAIKQAYGAYLANATDEIADQMDDLKTLRKFDFDQFISEISTTQEDNQDVSDRPDNSQPDSEIGEASLSDNQENVSGNNGNRSGRNRTEDNEADTGEGIDTEGSTGTSGSVTPNIGIESDQQLSEEDQESWIEDDDAGNSNGRGSDWASEQGEELQFDDEGDELAAEHNKDVSSNFKEQARLNRIKQKDAEKISAKLLDRSNIDETLPYLLPAQRDDVYLAEVRFNSKEHLTPEKAYGKGILFTNGTGTGKTLSGLGIVKRFLKQGKKNILIVTPSQPKVSDWIGEGKNLLIDIAALENTNDKGKGVNVTTFANFRSNEALKNRDFDLIIYDESHRLMETKDGQTSSTTIAHYKNGNASEHYALTRLQDVHPLWKEHKALSKRFRDLNKSLNNDQSPNPVQAEAEVKQLSDKLDALDKKMRAVEPALIERANNAYKNTKVIFLSATPFKAHFNLRYANRFLFDWGNKTTHIQATNVMSRVDAESQFYLDNFGAAYEWKFHRLQAKAKPNPEAIAMQEIEFNEKLKADGVAAGRIIDSEFDYSRDFPVVAGFDNGIFNKAFGEIFNYAKEAEYPGLRSAATDVFMDYNYTTQLFESMKAGLSTDRIKKHIKLGRKVVVFHRRQQGNASAPFISILHRTKNNAEAVLKDDLATAKEKDEAKDALAQVHKFGNKYKGLLEYEQTIDYRSAVQQLGDRFKGRIGFVNGNVSTKEKIKAIHDFNQDDSSIDVLVVQEDSGKEGISLHDTTNKFQRVLMSLSMPISSTTALQIEGRIYRIGQASNAIFEYPLLGLDLEVAHFGQNINKKVSTTENLALGELSRDLLRSYSEGVLFNSTTNDPDKKQGIGGKDYDKKAQQAKQTEFQRAKLVYATNQKTRGKRDNRPGIDFYPTPEPLGQKMIEWANVKEGEAVLEPSAGNGAIAMWTPKNIALTAVEPSFDLFSKLSARASGSNRKIVQSTFEEFNIINKFNAVVMNPPFGAAGTTALEHLKKAYQHLRNGGRIVALVPKGAFDKKFEKWQSDEEFPNDLHIRSKIDLPSVTFEQAGTAINAQILIIDKFANAENVEDADILLNQSSSDYSYAKTIDEFFDEIEDHGVMPRVPVPNIINHQPGNVERPKSGSLATLDSFPHTTSGATMYVVKLNDRVDTDKYYKINSRAKQSGGYYSKYSKGGAIPGFLFKSEAAASEVAAWVNKEYGTPSTETKTEEPQARPKLYEIMHGEQFFTIDDLAFRTGQPKVKVFKAIQDLWTRGLVNKSGTNFYEPTPEFKILLDDMYEHPDAYKDAYGELHEPKADYKSTVNVDENKIYDGLYNSGLVTSKSLAQIDAENIKKEIIKQYHAADIPIRKIIKYIANTPVTEEGKLDLWNEEIAKNVSAFLSNHIERDKYEDYQTYRARAFKEKTYLKYPAETLEKMLRESFAAKSKDQSIISGTGRKDNLQDQSGSGVQGLDLYSNPLPQLLKAFDSAVTFVDDIFKKHIGDKIYKKAGLALEKITPEIVKKQIITNYGLPAQYVGLKKEALNSIARYKELAIEIGDMLLMKDPKTKEKFSKAEQTRLQQIIRGSITSDPLLKARGQQAIDEIKKLEKLGKELEVLPIETYNSKLPRKRIAELLTEKAKIQVKLSEAQQKLEKKYNTTIAAQEDLLKLEKTPEGKAAIKEKIQEMKKDLFGRKVAVYQAEIDGITRKVQNSYKLGGQGYFKRVYLNKEQTKLLKKYGYVKPTRLDLTSAIARKDIPFEVRKKMGEVLTASYPVAKSIMLEGKDVSFGRFFGAIAENPSYAMTAEEFKAVPKDDWVQLPKDFKLGKLSEMYVPKNIADDINDVMKFTDPDNIETFFKQITANWKATKTIMNPSTHFRNIYSNSIMLDFSGVSQANQLRIIPEAIKMLYGKGQYAAKWKASHLNYTTFNAEELGKYLDNVVADRSFMDLSIPDKILKVYGKASLVDTKIGETLGKIYQMEELVGKGIKFISELEKNKTVKEATEEANKWLFDYSEVPKLVRTLRTNPFLGVPFITWSYKAFPRIIETAVTRPLTFWKYPVIFGALMRYALQALGLDDDEWKELQATLPDKMIKGQWLLLPFRDEAGKLQMLDLTYILPYKDAYDIMESGFVLATSGQFNNGDSVTEGILGLIQAPVFKTAAELATNRNTYSNMPIWYEFADTPGEKAIKAFDYMYKTYMPALAPEIPFLSSGGYAWNKLASVVMERDDYYGRSFTLAPAIASSMFGLKTSPVEPEKNIERKSYNIQAQIGELGAKRNRILRDGGMDIQERLEAAAELDQRIDDLRKTKQDLNVPKYTENIRQVEKSIRSKQRQLSKIPLSKKTDRSKLINEINTLKIELDQIKSSGDIYEGKTPDQTGTYSSGIESGVSY